MGERLAEFQNGRVGLHRLVNDLEALLHELEQTPEEWKDEFVKAWGGLEIAYALAVDRGTTHDGMRRASIASSK